MPHTTNNRPVRQAGVRTSLFSALLIVASFLLAACNLTEQSQSSAIVYLAKSMGPATQIHGAREDGSTWAITQETRWRDLKPDLGASGQLVFMSNRDSDKAIKLDKHRELFQLFLTDIGGTEPRPLTQGQHSATRPGLSPDGTRVAFIRPSEEGAELWSLELDNGEPQQWTRATEIFDFAWNPEGQILASAQVQSGQSRVEFLTLGSDQDKPGEPVVAPESSVITNLSWSPTGTHLAYIVHHREGARELWVRHLSSGEDKLVSNPDNHVQAPVIWSRNGRTLLYGSLVDFKFFYDEERREKVYEGAMHIFTSDLKGRETQLTQGAGRYGAPVYSPDEKRIAFLHADHLDAERLSLRTMNLDGTDVKTLDDNVAPASQLQWLTYTGEIQP